MGHGAPTVLHAGASNPSAAIPAIPPDAVEAPVEFGLEHRHCMSDGARPYQD